MPMVYALLIILGSGIVGGLLVSFVLGFASPFLDKHNPFTLLDKCEGLGERLGKKLFGGTHND